MRYLSFFALLLILVTGCTASKQAMQSAPYQGRIAAATERLGTSVPAQKVMKAINAMGGLEKWYGNGDLAYQFDYKPLDGSTPRNTYVTNDYRRARAVHQVGEGPAMRFGFDGKDAWSMSGEKVDGLSPRFWSLTPYYFVGLPFVLADEGINFAEMPQTTMDGNTYDMVKVTYDAGTGDASGDYYVLYLNQATGQLDALRYVVSYPGYFPDGGSTPEKLMKITGKITVDGVTLPTGYATYMWNEGEVSEAVTEITVTEYEFKQLDDAFFAMPAGSKVYNDLPE